MVTPGGIENDKKATSSIYEARYFSSDHENLDTRMALHA